MATVRIISGKIVSFEKNRAVAEFVAASNKALAAAGESYVRTVQNQLRGQISRASSEMSRVNINRIFKAITRTPVENSHTTVHTGRAIGARLREEGGVVRPRFRKLLAIPLNMNALRLQQGTITPNFVDPVANSLYYSPVKLQFIRTKAGKMFLIAKQDSKGKGKRKIWEGNLLFKLQRSANIPSRPYMAPSVDRGYPYALRAYERTMTAAFGGNA
jgi:hypothetical protein